MCGDRANKLAFNQEGAVMHDDLKMPPHNLDAERAVLGGMSMAEEAAEHGVSVLCENDFYSVQHGILFSTIKRLVAKKMPCDPVTMADELVASGRLEEVGGLAYVVAILEAVPNWAHTRFYANIVKRESVRRRMIHLFVEAQKDGYDTSVELEPLITRVSDALDDLVAERSTELQSASVVVQQMREEHTKPRYPHGTGLEDLDKMLMGGIRPGQLTVVAARPSIGKTSLGMQFAEHVARNDQPTAFFSVEMSAIELMERVAKQGPKRADEISALPMYIEDKYLDLDEILNCIRMAKRRNGVTVVVVDYLQLLRTNDRLQKHEKIERCANELKWIAKELRIAVVVLAQINRKGEERDNKKPRLADIKGAGGVEETADVAMLLHRPEFYDPDDNPGVAEIIVAKNRNGPTGTVQVGYIKEKTLFVPYANRPIDVSAYSGEGSPF